MIIACDAVVYFLCEIHRKGNQQVNVEGYTCIQNARCNVHVKGRKASGGVCFVLKDKMYRDHVVNRVDHGLEGILVLRLQNKVSKFSTVVIGTYLPPETSVY